MRRTAPSPASRKATAAVDALLEALQHPHKPGIEHLRRAILGVDSRIREEVKWNAPSFRLQDHFATFKLYPSSSIQVVLHTGAKPQKPPRKFSLEGAGGREVGSTGSLHRDRRQHRRRSRSWARRRELGCAVDSAAIASVAVGKALPGSLPRRTDSARQTCLSPARCVRRDRLREVDSGTSTGSRRPRPASLWYLWQDFPYPLRLNWRQSSRAPRNSHA